MLLNQDAERRDTELAREGEGYEKPRKAGGRCAVNRGCRAAPKTDVWERLKCRARNRQPEGGPNVSQNETENSRITFL